MCRRCGTSHSLAVWDHYPAGSLHRYCPDCDAHHQERRAANDAARARGYDALTHTPEYHRLQREREAERKGRTLTAYVPRAEKERRAGLARAERAADRHRKKMVGLLLQHYDWILDQNREITDAEREAWAARQREYYAQHRRQEIARHLAWKAAHPEKVITYDETRRQRIQETDDGTATLVAIARLKAKATNCAYCGSRLLRKETDHMTPVCLGGEHTLWNIVIVCPDCNLRKAKLPYAKWIERAEPQHRGWVATLWEERYGHLALESLLLPYPGARLAMQCM